MGYSMDMSKENQPGKLLPEGERLFTVIDMIPEVSKKGNDMFITKLLDVETKIEKTVWLVSSPGKRWMLKKLLTACGCSGGQDGVYNWDFDDVINKNVIGVVEHTKEKWINREGQEVETPKANIVEFFAPLKDATGNPGGVTDPSQVDWQE